MKKLFILLVILLVTCIATASILDTINQIPAWLRTAIGGTILVYGVCWAFSWFSDPIVIAFETNNPGHWGPFIFVDTHILDGASPDVRDYFFTHEYGHYLQYRLMGPLTGIVYWVSCQISKAKSGNIWEGNWMELQVIEWAHRNSFVPKRIWGWPK